VLLNCNIADDLEWSVTSEQRVAIAVFAASCVACQITACGDGEVQTVSSIDNDCSPAVLDGGLC